MAPSFDQKRLKQFLAIVRHAKAAWGADPPPPQQIALLSRMVEDVLREVGSGLV
jgi:hypothetical protein